LESALELDSVVVGGGVIGLAVARALASGGRSVTLLEAEARLGQHTSSRNSEVIHAGIYYPAGSLKAQLCVTGRELLYRYCAERSVPHARLGKLVVATREQELPDLLRLETQARAAGVFDLRWVERDEIAALEPEISAVRGLLSPSTGILDSHALLRSLARDAEQLGVVLALSAPLLGSAIVSSGFELQVGGNDPFRARARRLINAAGLGAQQLARSMLGMPSEWVPEAHYAKGHYFQLRGRSPFTHLIYPIPEQGGLGVHVTLDLAGNARFGPDVQFVPNLDYGFDSTRLASFREAIRRYYPSLNEADLAAGYTGIRPKLSSDPRAGQDFSVVGPRQHGVPRLVHLFGIESPGLTASLALAELVATLCD